MAKLDLKKVEKHLYQPSAKAVFEVDVPPMSYLTIDGSGNPNTSPDYVSAVEALYAVAYTLKFKVKKSAAGIDFAVMPLEGLWWVDDMTNFSTASKDTWHWRMMIRQPDVVSSSMVTEAAGEASKKKDLPAMSKLTFGPYHEGRAAQIMYIGPYADEGPTIEKLHAYIDEHGYQLSGLHHEIYLGDPRKTAPQKLKTIIRQPFKQPS